MMGAERKSLIISDDEKRATAYHEAGHALVAVTLPDADPLHKVTIIPRGHALGVTQQIPVDDRHTYSKKYLSATIAVLMGGRVAEELVLERLTTGAGNDFERSTEMARKMVCEWGMSEALGPLTFGKQEAQIFLGRESSQHRDYSEETARKIDEAVKLIITRAYDTARGILEEKSDALRSIAETLLDPVGLPATAPSACDPGRGSPGLLRRDDYGGPRPTRNRPSRRREPPGHFRACSRSARA